MTLAPNAEPGTRTVATGLRRWARGLLVAAVLWLCAWLFVALDNERASTTESAGSTGSTAMAVAASQRAVQAHLQQARQVLQGVMPDAASRTTADPMVWVQDAALFAPFAMALTRVMPDVRFVYFSSISGLNHGVENTTYGFRYGGRDPQIADPLVYSSHRIGASPLAPTAAAVAGGAAASDRLVWFGAAVQSPVPVWRAAAWSTTQSQLVVTLAQSVRDKTGVMAGVVAADLGLRALDDALLQALRQSLGPTLVSKGAFAYLTDDTGALLASSPGERVVTPDSNGTLSRVAALRSAHSGIAGSAAALPATSTPLELAGAPYTVSRVGLRDAAAPAIASDPDWRLVVVVPRSGAWSDWAVWLPPVLAVLALASLLMAALLWQLAKAAQPKPRGATRLWRDAVAGADQGNDGLPGAEPRASGASATSSAAPASAERESATALRAELAARTDQLAVMSDRALSAARSRAAFLSVISHEFRTPLNGAVGMSALLRDTALNPEQHAYLDALTASNEQLQSMLDEIIDYCRAESDDAPWTASSQPVRQLVVQACAQAARQAAAKGLVFTVDAAAFVFDATGTPMAWMVETEPVRLCRIITILTLNAVKFTDKGSVRVVAAMRQAEPPDEDVWLELQVIDTGPGITSDQQALIFKPFTQVDASISRSHGGVGLGLAICKRLVAQLGGSLTVGSQAGEGAVFSVCLPASAATASANALRTPRALAALTPRTQQQRAHNVLLGAGGQRVLVVDDNLINLKVASAMLNKFGYIVQTAGGGQEAIDAVCRSMVPGQQGSIQAVLMDIHMPGLDGIEATEAIRATCQSSAPPIIALTADISGEHVQRCFDAGMVDYLTKPLQSEALRQALARWIVPVDVLSPAGGASTAPAMGPSAQDCLAPDEWLDSVSMPPRDLPPTAQDLELPTGLIDADRLNDFRQFDDSQFTITREVVNLLFKEVPLKLAAIEQAIDAQDVAALIAAAHSLRGVSGHVGAVVVQHLCAVMERSATELGVVSPDARAGLIALRSAWKRTQPLLEDVR